MAGGYKDQKKRVTNYNCMFCTIKPNFFVAEKEFVVVFGTHEILSLVETCL